MIAKFMEDNDVQQMEKKGRIQVGCDADITLLRDDLSVDTVLAKGKLLVVGGKAVVKGTFE